MDSVTGMVKIAQQPLPGRPKMRRRPPCASQIAWHIGNRHMAAQIEKKRILVPRDHVAKAMLQGLGAEVRDVTEPFIPMQGAYHAPH